MLSLAQLSPGHRARILQVPPEKKRLLALGLRPGTVVEILLKAPLGDPLEVRAGETYLLLRRAEARGILVEALIAADPHELPPVPPTR
ncbi:ferrous iron transport protein A [Thermus sp. PS18]|uniref:FeoA family protein n=1 Tax=Thermus sp. PS18 TaxID=2849039 RepID=UPI002264D9D4|nr:FeoA family protein [Thermus sp. PS18]UZX15204.1 ferrous iron transport protein A [Thermus sp. PS18]